MKIKILFAVCVILLIKWHNCCDFMLEGFSNSDCSSDLVALTTLEIGKCLKSRNNGESLVLWGSLYPTLEVNSSNNTQAVIKFYEGNKCQNNVYFQLNATCGTCLPGYNQTYYKVTCLSINARAAVAVTSTTTQKSDSKSQVYSRVPMAGIGIAGFCAAFYVVARVMRRPRTGMLTASRSDTNYTQEK
eukprot:c13056_g1_i2.p1 GENE.c13056_g1_i2~~c13056_g1_i2.p1  ORF type:complete len:197 (+),score=29.50 c13056_g1_i2:28-591(+)